MSVTQKTSAEISWHIYILKCRDGSLYTGCTNNLEKRVITHSSGKGGKYTRAHLPVKLVYSEKVIDHSGALKREWEIKKMNKRQKLELIFNFLDAF